MSKCNELGGKNETKNYRNGKWKENERKMDGWMDGWMNGWMDDGWMDGWMDGKNTNRTR